MEKLGINHHSAFIMQVFALCVGALLSMQVHAALFSTVKHPMPADQAFAVTIEQSNDKIDIVWSIADNYYLYQDKLAFTTSNGQPLSNLALPQAVIKQDPTFGTTKVYYNQLHITGTLPSALTKATYLTIHYQGCWNGGVCYPPQTKTMALADFVTVASSNLPKAQENTDWTKTTSTNANWFLQNLENTNLTTLLVIFFLAGLALAFTPCVLPMVPILSSIIVGLSPKPGPGKSFLLSLVYVLTMAATYSLAGVVAGLSGSNIQIALQHPAVIGTTATLFVFFAIAMFGWVNVQMPQGIQNKINTVSNRQLGGQATGVAVMGVLSALIVGPCVAAPLAGALLFIAQAGDATTGGLALFVMGLGMGVPLLLVGTSASKWIPKTGPWMHRIKVGFGFLMLLMAVWMTDRVWPELSLIFVALITIVLAFVLALHHRWNPTLESLSAAVISYTLAMFLGLYGILLVVGQLAGTGSLLKPLGVLVSPYEGTEVSSEGQQGKQFILTKVLPEAVAPILAQAKLDKQPVMLDFYADWCISCKELDAFVFKDQLVQLALADFKAIKVDVTLNTKQAQKLMQSLRLVGPPALVFYTSKGELFSETVIGVPAVDDLVDLLQQVNSL
ncbi:protein-disulfide reductase DsbD [Candidatus Njordibacter sp. Uisw_002]|uniref:protein-disulfide reductase DsbD n=1 Tax=Candidatus Njordibacter sp. Uisw_002 TaxID=3230971 RepID=UPI003D42CF5F